jgi:hypothetical protein
MMQIVPVGSQARRAAAVARLVRPLLRAAGASLLAVSGALGLLRRASGG